MITNITDFEKYFPSVRHDRPQEWHSACPFCQSGEPAVQHNGVTFYGEDRLIWFINNNVFLCRRCRDEGRGRGGKGVFTLLDAAALFGTWVADDVERAIVSSAQKVREEVPLNHMWIDAMVQAAHQRVDRSYWKAFNWPDEVIDRFRLGKGRFMGKDDLHIIPMKLTRIFKANPEDVLGERSDWYIATRGADRPYRSSGSVYNYWWHIVNNVDSDVVLLAEGEKDAISLAYLFPEYNIVTTWGAASWTLEKTRELANRYKELRVYGDNDEAGHALIEAVYEFAKHTSLNVSHIDWDALGDEYIDCDVTDVLARVGAQRARKLLSTLKHKETTIVDIKPIVAVDAIDLAILRDDANPASLYQHVKRYDETSSYNTILLLAAPPGSGKSYSLVKYVKQVARNIVEQRTNDRLRLEMQIDELKTAIQQALITNKKDDLPALIEALESAQHELETFSYAQIAWFGQYRNGYEDLLKNGMDIDLCFNYEARNASNCANYEIVKVMGDNNHDVGQFCSVACPFRQECAKSGYLSQEHKRKLKPVTFFRHDHLTASIVHDYKRLVIIDENPTHIYDGDPIYIDIDDLLPHDPQWSTNIPNESSVYAINAFIRAVRTAMTYNLNADPNANNEDLRADYIVSGAKFLSIVDKVLRSQHETELPQVMNDIDPNILKNDYQPNYYLMRGDYTKKRCAYDLYVTMLDEVAQWAQDPDNTYPSRIHCVAGKLHVYRKPNIQLRRRIPIVVADATAIPALYQGLFEKRVNVYAPDIYNPNAKTIIIKGSDYTKTQLRNEIGDAIRALRQSKNIQIKTTTNEVVNFQEITFDPDRYGSQIVYDAVTFIRQLSKQHNKLLVVTHKDLRELLEHLVPLPNVSFGHYGGLRGSNDFVDHDAALLIGAYRIPYDVMWMKIQAWAKQLNILDTIPRETTRVATYLHGEHRVFYRTFNHPFAAEYVDMIEVGELIQSAERIRPHSTNQEKYVYLLANRPALRYSTHVISKRDWLADVDPSSKQGSVLNYVLAFIDEKYQQHGLIITPKYRDVTKRFHISNTKAKQIFDKAIEIYRKNRLGIDRE